MPTGSGMFGVSRVSLVFVAAAVAFGFPTAADAANTKTNPTPTTIATRGGTSSTVPSTVPGPTTTIPVVPPPPFALPSDFGYKLLEQMNAAKQALAAAQKSLAPAEKGVKSAKKHDVDVKKQLKKLTAQERATAKKLDATRARLRQAAAEAYIHAGGADIL